LNKEEKKIGQGAYVICELDSVYKQDSEFQATLRALDNQIINKCDVEWAPKSFNPNLSLSPGEGGYGRTTILPALFKDWYDGTVKTAAQSVALESAQAGGIFGGSPVGTWRQKITAQGHMVLLHGVRTGDTIPEDFKIAWAGMAFPNKQQHITELKWQIGDRKYGRINIEEMLGYNKPAIIFEDGYILNEEESFDLYAYVRGPIPTYHDGSTGIFQRAVMLGATYFKVVSKVLGAPGSAI